MEACIFCAIVKGEIPSAVVYEDEKAIVIMDIHPVIKGHALVLPKKHYGVATDTPDELLSYLHIIAKRLARAQMNRLGAEGVNILQNNGRAAGQEVDHIHIHVIPRFSDDKHHWNWKTKTYDDASVVEELAQNLLAGM